MRFDNPPPTAPQRALSPRNRTRLWLLVCMLGGTLFAMQRLRAPETVHTLGRLLLLDSEPKPGAVANADSGSRPSRDLTDGQASHVESVAPLASQPATADSESSVRSANRGADNGLPPAQYSSLDESWQAVRDNAPFLSTEQEAWFSVLRRMSETDERALARQSLGEVAYAQLRAQPEQYRGRVVTVRGRVLREATKTPAPNQLGIHAYHELVLAPAGGGRWPMTAYCLALPEGFPRGKALDELVVVHGVFFKVRSYSYGDGFGLAPVLLAPGVVWQSPSTGSPEVASSASRPVATRVGVAAALAIGVAALAAAYAFASTRRDRRRFDPSNGAITLPDSSTSVRPSPEAEIEALAQQERSR